MIGGNEAGMLLGGEVRAADAAVWRDQSPPTEGFARTPPILAAKVAGREDTGEALQAKARWYLDHGTEVVWIVLPRDRKVHVVTKGGIVEVGEDRLLPRHDSLPDLALKVKDFFRQLR